MKAPDDYRPILGMTARLYTPEYHRELAALHASGPCGCESCGVVRDGVAGERGQVEMFR